MSSHLGIAAALAALKNALASGYAELGVSVQAPDVGPPVAPTSEAPVRVFPYRIAPNPSMMAEDLPTRTRDGAVRLRPTLGVDVHVLICFCATDWDTNVRAAGATTAILHARPYLSASAVGDPTLTNELDRVNVTMEALSSEELSRLWSSLIQSDYALSLPYKLSGIVIEAPEAPARQVLPVRTPQVYVRTFGGPVVERVEHAGTTPETTPIEADQRVRIVGTSLRAAAVSVRIDGRTWPLALSASEPAHRDTVSPTEIVFALYTREDTDADAVPDASLPREGLRAGIRSLQVIHDTVFSNAVPMAVHPRIDGATATPSAVTLSVTPAVDATQACRLYLSPTIEGAGRLLTRHAGSAADGTLTFSAEPPLAAGTWQLRLQVDGVDNIPSWTGSSWAVPTAVVP